MATEAYKNKVKQCGVRRLAESFGVKLKQLDKTHWIGNCPNPHHNERGRDEHASFEVILNDDGYESWCCHTCHVGPKGGPGSDNQGSDNIELYRWMYYHTKGKELSFGQCLKGVATFYGIEPESSMYERFYMENNAKCLSYQRRLIPYVRMYLHDRGINDEMIKKWRIGFDGDRITFPICNGTGDIVGFSNREFSIRSKQIERKYINSSSRQGFDKKQYFFGMNHINHAEKRIFIVEGQIDAIVADRYGLPNPVALMTCHLSEAQADYIKRYDMKPILCLDGDEHGQDGMKSAIEILHRAGVTNESIVILPKDKDVADLGVEYKDRLKDFILARVEPYYQHLIKSLADQMDAAILLKQQELLPKALEAISQIADPIQKELAKELVRKRIVQNYAA